MQAMLPYLAAVDVQKMSDLEAIMQKNQYKKGFNVVQKSDRFWD